MLKKKQQVLIAPKKWAPCSCIEKYGLRNYVILLIVKETCSSGGDHNK